MRRNLFQAAKERATPGCLAAAAVVAGLLLILHSTLRPFTFQIPSDRWLDALVSGYVLRPSSALDIVRNLLLFMPFGFALGALLQLQGWTRNRVRWAVLLSGFLLTVAVESLQNFLPDRQPSFADLIANSLGALMGLDLLRLWQRRDDWLNERLLIPERVFTGLLIYAAMLLLVGRGLASSVTLQEWEPGFPLLLGNEKGGGRPWRGAIRDLLILDHALTQEDARRNLAQPDSALVSGDRALAHYPLAGDYGDLSGQQPHLVWRPHDLEADSGSHFSANGVHVGSGHWLETEYAVRDLSQSLQRASSFSLFLSTTPADVEQGGPARIISISTDPFLRNLTVGQEGHQLIVRVRTPLMGENGTAPQLSFPHFFATEERVAFFVIFDGLAARVIDSRFLRTRSIELLPGIAFIGHINRSFLPILGGHWQVSDAPLSGWGPHLLFYFLTLLPIGVLLGQPLINGWTVQQRWMLFLVSILLIPFLLELSLVSRASTDLRPLHLIVSVAIILLTAWVLAPVVSRLVRNLRRTSLCE